MFVFCISGKDFANDLAAAFKIYDSKFTSFYSFKLFYIYVTSHFELI